MVTPWQLRQARRALFQGGLIAYPTEAVYGLGCDPLNPVAVRRLLDLKARPVSKGLILVAASLEQLTPYILPIGGPFEADIRNSWPGPATWVIPARPDVPSWLTGSHDSIAVRVSAHPVVVGLCTIFGGPVVSTSANPSGRPPARDPLRVRRYFGDEVNYILHGPLGRLDRPTAIRDGRTGNLLRP